MYPTRLTPGAGAERLFYSSYLLVVELSNILYIHVVYILVTPSTFVIFVIFSRLPRK
jgi:hypothetical protein